MMVFFEKNNNRLSDYCKFKRSDITGITSKRAFTLLHINQNARKAHINIFLFQVEKVMLTLVTT